MVELDVEQAAQLRAWFPDRPGPCAGLHVLNTGIGATWSDRRSQPRVVLARTGSDYSLVGDAAAVTPAELEHLARQSCQPACCRKARLRAATL